MAEHKKLLLSMSIEANLYKTLHKTIEAMVYECRLGFDKSGLSISAVDGSNVAMYTSSVDKSVFEKYTIKKPFEVGWTLSDIKEKGVMNALPKNSNITFKFSSDYPCELSCEIVKGFNVEYLIAPRIES